MRLDGTKLLDDESPYCETRMFQVCRTGNLQALTELLHENETLANRTYHSVFTGHPEYPLAVTIKYGHTDCARTLIGRGADVNAADHQGETPLHIAARLRRTEDFNTLIKAGADINNVLRPARSRQTGGGKLCLETLISPRVSQRTPDLNGALYAAAEEGQTECLRFLIEKGADKLDHALYRAILARNKQSRTVLIEKGANITTVVHSAASEGNCEFL